MSYVECKGPIFDGMADLAAHEMCNKIEEEVAREGVRMVRDNLHGVIRHPTGYYESHISVRSDGDHSDVVDGGVIYGPWLEGVGSRNRTTRFKGYATFRRTVGQLDAAAGAIANRVAPLYVRRMG